MSVPHGDQSLPSEKEFLGLPSCIQKKYFSSLERLHIAYQAAQHLPRIEAGSNKSADISPPITSKKALSRHSITPSPDSVASHLHLSRRPSRRDSKLSKRSRISFDTALASQAEFQWFCSLPEKVRRQHFSKDEREAIASALDHLTTTPESKRSSRNISTRGSPTPNKSSHNRSGDHTPEPIHNMDLQQLRGHPVRKTTAGRQLSISRPVNSMSHIRTPSSTTAHSPTINSPHLYASHRREWSQSGPIPSFSRRTSESSTTAIDPDAVYYRNPEARHKLRQYLASPQKFDEAVTFGFPSSPGTESEREPSPTPIPQSSSNNDAKAFLQNDSLSFLDDDGLSSSYETSEVDTESPSTPADPEWSWRSSRYNRVSIFGGLNSESIPSLDLKFQPEIIPPTPPLPSAQTLANREMTLRMTLTRPDLRANDEEMYGWKRNVSEEDPFTLEELPPIIEDTTGAHGAFAVPHKPQRLSVFSKLIKRMRR